MRYELRLLTTKLIIKTNQNIEKNLHSMQNSQNNVICT